MGLGLAIHYEKESAVRIQDFTLAEISSLAVMLKSGSPETEERIRLRE